MNDQDTVIDEMLAKWRRPVPTSDEDRRKEESAQALIEELGEVEE